jgi:Tol biopolymer transport system component
VHLTAVLVAAAALAGSAPAPLPHGLLAFSGQCHTCPPAGEGANLFTLRPDGKALQIALSNAADPRWSPNGRELVFDRIMPGGNGGGFSALWRSTADGSGLRQLTPSNHYDGEADWSPDGKRIVFVRTDPDAALADRSALWVVRRDGSGARLLLRARMGGAGDPEWSPDGRRIVFAASADRIYEVGSDGRGLRLLRVRGRSPRSSPDGRSLAFVYGKRNRATINVLDRKRSRLRTFVLDKTGVSAGPIAWSADGRWLVFGRGRDVRDPIGGVQTTRDLWGLRLSDGRRKVILRDMDLDGLDWRRN